MKRLFFALASFAAYLVFSGPAIGEIIPGYPDDFRGAYDPRELALLPGYCKYTQLYRQHVPGGDNKAEIDRMYATLGPGFHTLHHYCWAIIGAHRGLFLARTKQTREFYLTYAIKDIDFVIDNSPPDFALLPELRTEKAKYLIHLGKGPLAIAELLRAIQDKPDYWPPYAVLGDYYKDQGDLARAREILQQGLKIMPDARPLKTRFDRLAQGTGKHIDRTDRKER